MRKQTFYRPHTKKDRAALLEIGLVPSRLSDKIFYKFTPALIKELADKFQVKERTIKKYVKDNKPGGPLTCAPPLFIIQKHLKLCFTKILDC